MCLINSKPQNSHLTNELNGGELIYKQKKQSAKTLQNKNKSGGKLNNVLEDHKEKHIIKDKTKTSFNNLLGTENNSEIKHESCEVNKLVNDATNSIIEKTCLDDIDIKSRKLDDTRTINKIQEGHDAITNGNTQSKYTHF